MKKKSLLILCFALATLSLTACGNDSSSSSTDSVAATATTEIEATEAETTEIETEAESTETQEDTNASQFKTGLWEEIDGEDISGWYYFSDDMTECSYHDDKTGNGIPFDYEIDGTDYIFHMGAADDNTYATVAFDGEDDAVITWDDGRTSKIRFVENTKYEDFDTQEGRGDVIDDAFAAN